eukprot:TRINITY_DN5499_c0_g1_i1.p1 TRINITY_DN5499_c0_g1~~TRINITY_DN5499_c0_g1_i1.p1  ORF type:complete len:1509 (+),score=288.75 TRINITY_DN5499_c0_g1_i1:48-4574(+)
MAKLTLPRIMERLGLPATTQKIIDESTLTLTELWSMSEQELTADFSMITPEELLILLTAKHSHDWYARPIHMDLSRTLCIFFPELSLFSSSSADETVAKRQESIESLHENDAKSHSRYGREKEFDFVRMSCSDVEAKFSPHERLLIQHLRYVAHLMNPTHFPAVTGAIELAANVNDLVFDAYGDAILSALAWLIPLVQQAKTQEGRNPLSVRAVAMFAHICWTHQHKLLVHSLQSAEWAAEHKDPLAHHVLALDRLVQINNAQLNIHPEATPKDSDNILSSNADKDQKYSIVLDHWQKALQGGMVSAKAFILHYTPREDSIYKTLLGEAIEAGIPSAINTYVAYNLKLLSSTLTSSESASLEIATFDLYPKEKTLTALRTAALVADDSDSLYLLAYWHHAHPSLRIDPQGKSLDAAAHRLASQSKVTHQESIQCWALAAERGESLAHTWLGDAYASAAQMDPHQVANAIFHYATGALQGDVTAMGRLANLYEDGRLVRKCYVSSLDYATRIVTTLQQSGRCRTSFENDVYRENLVRLSYFYRLGLGTKPDAEQAFKYAKLAYEEHPSSPLAIQSYALCVLNGLGIGMNLETGLQLLKQAAGLDEAKPMADQSDAQVNLVLDSTTGSSLLVASMYNFGIAVPRDFDQSYQIFEKIFREMGSSNPFLALHLSTLHMTGKSSLALLDASRSVAYLKAAIQSPLSRSDPFFADYLECQYKLGLHYIRGEGTLRNEDVGSRCLQLAAQQGHAEATNEFGVYMESSNLPNSLSIAARVYTLATKRGSKAGFVNLRSLVYRDVPEAIALLGLCYLRGWGCDADPAESEAWIHLSCEMDCGLGKLLNIDCPDPAARFYDPEDGHYYSDDIFALKSHAAQGIDEAKICIVRAMFKESETLSDFQKTKQVIESTLVVPFYMNILAEDGEIQLLKARCEYAIHLLKKQSIEDNSCLNTAISFYRVSAEYGNLDALYELGLLLLTHKTTPKQTNLMHQVEAFTWLSLAAENSHIEAIHLLGECFENGWGICPSLEKALELYKRGSELNHIPSVWSLARIYHDRKTYKDALECYRTLISLQPDPKCLYWGAWFMEHGVSGCCRDLQQARIWYEKVTHFPRTAEDTSTDRKKFPWDKAANKTDVSVRGFQIEAHYRLGCLYAMTHGDPRIFSYKLAATHLQTAAAGNHPGAMKLWARLLYRGGSFTSMALQQEEAYNLLLEAARRGSMDCHTLRLLADAESEAVRASDDTFNNHTAVAASLYQHKQTSIEQSTSLWLQALQRIESPSEMVSLLLPLVSEGHVPAMITYSILLLDVISREKQHDQQTKNSLEAEAAHVLSEAAKKGHPVAENTLGYCFENGVGSVRNASEAYEWYLRAAQKGNPAAAYNVSRLLIAGVGVKRDRLLGVAWLRFAANNGSIPAQYNLGLCLLNNIGHEIIKEESQTKKSDAPSTLADPTDGISWIRRAALLGNAAAQNTLAVAYLQGVHVAKDSKAAQMWLSQAIISKNTYKPASLNRVITYNK